jgi:molybdopterin-guanine dinucleotide biosynthesis protein A
VSGPERPDGAAAASRLLGVVFAGGKSRRMGQDKALLPWPVDPAGGREAVTLMERAARVLEGLGCAVEIARGSGERTVPGGRPVVLDAAPDAGPLAGLLSALERAQEAGREGVLALACDMPLVGAGDLLPLAEAVSSEGAAADAAMWLTDGREQPLCAAYHLRCLPAVRAAFEGGARRLIAPFEAPRGGPIHGAAAGGRAAILKRLVPDENSSARLVNLNTMTDYDRVARDVGGASP